MTITEQVIKQGSAAKLNGDSHNCTVLSFAAATNIPYDQAYGIAQDKWLRVKGKGVTTSVLSRFFGEDNINVCKHNIVVNDIAIKFVSKKVDVKNYYLYKRTGKVNTCQMNINSFIKKYPKGTYYMLVSAHAFVIKDGEVLDHESHKTKMNRRIKAAWNISDIK
jgi:hypothetical protein